MNDWDAITHHLHAQRRARLLAGLDDAVEDRAFHAAVRRRWAGLPPTPEQRSVLAPRAGGLG